VSRCRSFIFPGADLELESDRASDPADIAPLLDDVGQLVDHHVLPGRRRDVGESTTEEDMGPSGEGPRAEFGVELVRGAAAVHPHIAQVGAHRLLEAAADPRRHGRATGLRSGDPPARRRVELTTLRTDGRVIGRAGTSRDPSRSRPAEHAGGDVSEHRLAQHARHALGDPIGLRFEGIVDRADGQPPEHRLRPLARADRFRLRLALPRDMLVHRCDSLSAHDGRRTT
jgi:hypothetical protein